MEVSKPPKREKGVGLSFSGAFFSPEGSLACFSFCFLIYLFIYFWLHWVFIAARGLFSSCGERGLLFVVVRRLLLLWSTGSRCAGFSSCGTRAQ